MVLSPERCLIIGEVAQAHDGSLGMAHAYIDAVADAGADAVKFQTHIADAESSPEEPFRVKFSRQDETRYGYWKRLEFTEPQWAGLAAHAAERGLLFLSSPFSMEAVELLLRCGLRAFKIASGEISNRPMLERILETGLPVILSTGMSPWREIDDTVALLRRDGADLALLQCTTAYPCPPERVGLNLISELRERYGCYAGLSDHSGTIYPGLAGAALGMDVLEVHVTFDRATFGPDVPASVTFPELRQLVHGIRFIETMRRHPLDKDASAEAMGELRGMFMKSLVAARDIPSGTVLAGDHLTTRKPAKGIPADRYREVLGRTTGSSLKAGEFLQFSHLV